VPKTEFVILPGPGVGSRLDVCLAGQVPGLSRAAARKLIDDGKVLVNGKAGKASVRLKEGDKVEAGLESREDAAEGPGPQQIPLEVLFADEDVIVLDKPSGLVVHPGAGNVDGTLANALVALFPELAGVGPRERPGIVHRLDKGTSGVMVAARSPRAYASLVGQFKRHDVRKTYIGLVYGRIASAEGHIDWPIGRHATKRKRISTHSKNPRQAETFFRVLEALPCATLLEVRPLTGRTHQIRVHLAAAGHPIVGDALYGRKKEAKKYPRIFLHARSISFLHPGTGERLEFAAPLPAELEAILEAERRRPGAKGT
jgi:23S rRNA pseudouridine1911/1915/1917 synthase